MLLKPQLPTLADRARGFGAVFIELDVWDDPAIRHREGEAGWLRAAGDIVSPLFEIERLGVPVFVYINRQGIVSDIFVGYVPGVTEEALGAALARLVVVAEPAQAGQSTQR